MIVLLSTMSGYLGYRAIGDFIEKYKLELIKIFKPKKDRVPSFSTVHRLIMAVNPLSFQSIYKDWLLKIRAAQTAAASPEESERAQWHPIDGKAIRGAKKIIRI
ncbi:MAG: transposase family protein [Saprospiraceae bacterium]